jgi:Ribosomal RNA methyltransferase (FmrO)
MGHGKQAAIDVAAIAAEIAATRKYADVHAESIARAAQAALRTSPKRLSDAVHYAKEKLHQWCGAYREGEVAKLERRLEESTFAGGDDPAARAFAEEAMRLHASTAERIPEIDAIGAALRDESAGALEVVDLCATRRRVISATTSTDASCPSSRNGSAERGSARSITAIFWPLQSAPPVRWLGC